MPELGPYGSVRGARGNSRPYRESWISSLPRAAFGAKRPFAVETSGDRRFGSARRCSTFTTWARPGSELILEKIQADLVAHLPVRPRVASRALSARRFDWQRAPPTRRGLS